MENLVLVTPGNTERAISTHPSQPQTGLRPCAPSSYDDRLNHILQAATSLIAEVGYEKASMRAVAHAAGVSLAGLYHYFVSKEHILFLIQYRTFNALVNNLREKLHGVDDPTEQLRVMVRTHVGYFAANLAALKVCSHELDSLSGDSYEETSRIRHEYYGLVRGIIDRLVEASVPGSPLDRYVATMSLFGMLNWLYRWYDPTRGRSPNVVANQLATQFLHGLDALGTEAQGNSRASRKPVDVGRNGGTTPR
jgi:TetR/AcrR family transcriptional regulator, cholesterol catabolism regulator